jgi:predicted transcriptional regulator
VHFVEDLKFINDLFLAYAMETLSVQHMRRSKLETYEAILEALIKKPSTIDRISYETDIDCATLRQRLDSLLKNSLVEERSTSRKTFYAITERGLAVLKTLNFQKYLEKVANTIKVMDEALQLLPTMSGYSNEKENEPDEKENI